MQVVVLLAGVVDPRSRLDGLALRPGTALVDEAGLPRRLSPFDEAALETALALRDADPAVTVSAVLPGGEESDALLRTVAAFRPQRAFRFGGAATPSLWDPRAAVRLLGAAVAAATQRPDLVLIGREFGDGDDGTLPPALAEAQGWRFCGHAHAVAPAAGGGADLVLRRMRGGREEVLRLRPPVLASITNARGNRLRHPLMKNVVLAKREPVPVVAPPPAEAAPALVLLRAIAAQPPPRRGSGECRLLTGPVEAQVGELAAWLRQRHGGAASGR